MLWKRLKANQMSVAHLKPESTITEDMCRAIFSLLGYLSKNDRLSRQRGKAIALHQKDSSPDSTQGASKKLQSNITPVLRFIHLRLYVC